MSLSRLTAMLGLGAVLAIAPAAWAQQNIPRVGYLFPAGAKQGTTLMITVGGRYLDGTTHALVSGTGVEAKVVEYFKPITQSQASSLKARLQKLVDKKAAAETSAKPAEKERPKASPSTQWTAEDEMLLAALKKKLAILLLVVPVPATAETVMLQVSVAADAAPGRREIRLVTPKGLTSPMAFCVGQLPEIAKEIPNVMEQAAAKPPRYREEIKAAPPEPPTSITLPVVVNGQITPGGADRYTFAAHKGQKIVIAAHARELIPYISDAVPGWFQAALSLYDAKGHELAYADHYLFHPDPVLYCEVPEDGEYTVEIRDSLYRGREDFVYRITLGELPFVTSIFPLGGPVGARTAVEMRGWNLPATSVTQDAKDAGPGVYLLAVDHEQPILNPIPFSLDTLPECLEKEPDNSPENAQPITLPVIVNGRIDPPDQWDVFRFEGNAGEEIVAEVHARRLNSPLDSVLKLVDAGGRQLAYNDDHEDKGAGLFTHHADSYLRATLPAKGTYFLHLSDAQHKGGPEYAYRLRISRPRPDFELRLVPASITGRSGASVPITVYAIRKDGFTGEIALALKDAPDEIVLGGSTVTGAGATGVAAAAATVSGSVVPANQDQVKLTLKVLPLPQEKPVNLKLVGTATIQGHEVTHLAVPSEDMIQAFEYRHLVPAQELKVAVSGRYTPPRPMVKIISKMPIKIPAGGAATLQLSVSPRSLISRVKIELRKPLAGITIEKMTVSRDGLEIVLHSDGEKGQAGLRGSLTLAAAAEKPAEPGKTTPAKADRASQLPTVPSIAFEIIKP